MAGTLRKRKKIGLTRKLCSWLGCGTSDPNARIQDGIVEKRTCTDLPFCFLLLALNAVLVSLIVVPAVKNGYENRLLGAEDYMTNICGLENMKEKSMGAWPDLEESDFMVCIESCGKTSDLYGYDTRRVAHWCMPKEIPERFKDWKSYWALSLPVRQIHDLYHERDKLCFTALITVVLLFIWYVIAAFLYTLIAYIVGVGIVLASAAGAWIFLSMDDPSAQSLSFWIGIGFIVFGVISLVLLGLAWRSIQEVAKILDRTGKAILRLPELGVMPFVGLAACVCLLAAAVTLIIFLYSEGTYLVQPIPDSLSDVRYSEVDVEYYVFEIRKAFRSELVFVFLWLYWSVQFVVYFNYLVVSGCIAQWYIRKYIENVNAPKGMDTESNEESGKGKNNWFLCCVAIWRTVRYHLGTVAFASLVIGILQIVESILLYFHKQVKENGKIAKVLCCCCKCLVDWLKCCLHKLNQGSLVFTAIFGCPLLPSLGRELNVFFSDNSLTVALCMATVSLMKTLANYVVCALATAVVAVCFFDPRDVDSARDVAEAAVPLLACLAVSWTLAHMLLSVWECAAITILHCFALHGKTWKGSVKKSNPAESPLLP